MRLLFIAVYLGFASKTAAIMISPFPGLDGFVARSSDIVIARCLALPEGESRKHEDGFYPVDVEVSKVLKGDRHLGRLRVGTIYPMTPGQLYLLSSSGGSAFGTSFLAVGEMTVVPMSGTFDLDLLQNLSLKEEVQFIFSRRLFELEQQLRPQLAEQKILGTAVNDGIFGWYRSRGPLKVTGIRETVAERSGATLFLRLGDEKMEYSVTSPGRTGEFYFRAVGTNSGAWEFAATDAHSLEELDGHPLSVKFYGQFTPGIEQSGLRSPGFGVEVESGQIFIARMTTAPNRIIAVLVKSQATPLIAVRYAILEE